MTALVKYDQACRALAEAKAVDEVKDIRDQAEAMRVYAHQAKNRDLEIDAAEIRMRAERRLGEMIVAQRETIGLNKGGRPPEKTRSETEQVSRPTLEDAGIDRKLSSRAQKMAAVPAEQFEKTIGSWRERVRAENERVTVDLLRHGEEEQQRQNRRDLAATLGDESHRLTGRRKFACVYADPAWRRKAGIGGRAYENHYPTMTWDEILALPIKDRLLPDAWLFLWLPRAHLLALHTVAMDVVVDDGEILKAQVRMPLAWAIANSWGFDNYSTLFVWTKTDDDYPDDVGMGLVVRDQDEVLCLFKRGRGLPKPASDEKFGSNHRERSKPLGHSRKPEFYREMIATMTGGIPVLELFARVDAEHPLPPNWEAWGNEADAPENDTSEELDCQANADAEARPCDPTIGRQAGTSDGTIAIVDPVAESASRLDARRSASATSERMDVTAGETAPNSANAALDIPAFLRRSSDGSNPDNVVSLPLPLPLRKVVA
jgi:N6-adenosine-specific RNA methylase IME4